MLLRDSVRPVGHRPGLDREHDAHEAELGRVCEVDWRGALVAATVVEHVQVCCRDASNLASVANETFVAVEPSSRSKSTSWTGASTQMANIQRWQATVLLL